MSYQSTVEQLYALGHELASTPSNKFDLAYVREMLAAMGNPERRFPSVLIAGTNGKGSTGATLASILRAAGYKTALYSSPHLVRINERIRVNGEPISDVEFSEIHDRAERTAHAGLPHIAQPEVDRIEAELAGDLVDHQLGRGHGFERAEAPRRAAVDRTR